MSDPLSISTAVVGLVMAAAQLGDLSKKLRESATGAPASIVLIQEEMDHLHKIFGHVEGLVKGTEEKFKNGGLTMVSLYDLMTILSGCVLVFSNLDKKMSKVAGLDPKAQKPTQGVRLILSRVNWALWKEAEIEAILQDLQRYKISLNLMLVVIQWYVCNFACHPFCFVLFCFRII